MHYALGLHHPSGTRSPVGWPPVGRRPQALRPTKRRPPHPALRPRPIPPSPAHASPQRDIAFRADTTLSGACGVDASRSEFVWLCAYPPPFPSFPPLFPPPTDGPVCCRNPCSPPHTTLFSAYLQGLPLLLPITTTDTGDYIRPLLRIGGWNCRPNREITADSLSPRISKK